MKSIKSVLFAVLVSVSACGGDSGKSVDPMSFMPTMPAKPIAEQPVSAPVNVEPAKPAIVEQRVLPTKYEDALAQGRELEAKGDHARAKELFEAAIKLDKKKAEPHVELARVYIATGDKALAVVAANKAVKLAPLSSQAWNTKGRAELNRFDYDAAIEAFSKAVELNRDNVWAWNNLGYAELQLKKYDEAVEHLTEATSRAGATGFMFNNLGTALEQLDRLDEARTAFEAGGKLGSKEALASRARLEGVKSIALAKQDTSASPKTTLPKTFENNEGQIDEDVKSTGDGAGSDQKQDEPKSPTGDDTSDAGVKSTM